MTLTIDISPETKTKLDVAASQNGQQTPEYLREVIENLVALVSPYEEADEEAERIESGWASLTALIDRCQMETGITDLAHQHDHYIHGTPKRED